MIICEPRVQSSSHLKELLKLGFDKAEIIEASGFSGGIWLIWNSSVVHMDHVISTTQSITMKVSTPGSQPWILTAVYASTNYVTRNSLWDHLDGIPTRHNLPWFITGDFNEILSSTEKKGGPRIGKTGGFKRWVDRAAMIDMGFQGPVFTWTNNTVKERIDRCLCNDDWRLLFPEARVENVF